MYIVQQMGDKICKTYQLDTNQCDIFTWLRDVLKLSENYAPFVPNFTPVSLAWSDYEFFLHPWRVFFSIFFYPPVPSSGHFNFLTHKAGYHLISPYYIPLGSHIKVTRLTEMITN